MLHAIDHTGCIKNCDPEFQIRLSNAFKLNRQVEIFDKIFKQLQDYWSFAL